MAPPSFVKFFIGAKVKTYPESFPGIGSYPIVPGTNLKIADIQVTVANKIECIRVNCLKTGALVSNVSIILMIPLSDFAQFFMTGFCPEGFIFFIWHPGSVIISSSILFLFNSFTTELSLTTIFL